MKYIIDIEDEPFTRKSDGEKLYLSQFTPAIFAERELHFLTPYDESATEQRGQEEAWSFAQKILAPPNNSDAMTVEDIMDCYGTDDAYDVICEMTFAEASEKYEAWKEQKNEIKVGDEVAFHHDDGRPDTVVVVTYIGSDGYIDGMDGRGTQYAHKNPDRWTKTGRHFPEVADLLEKMREPE